MIDPAQRAFLDAGRVGHLATADEAGVPHVVPVCYAVAEQSVYITIDAKPKTGDVMRMKRLRNIAANPQVALVVDHYDEDWSRLGWIMLRGAAELLASGPEHDAAQALLRERYEQYRQMALAALPVIAIRVSRVTAWGRVAAAGRPGR